MPIGWPGVIPVLAVSLCAAALGCSSQRTDSRVPVPRAVAGRELTPDQQIRQAVNRLTFGGRPGDFGRVRELGVDRWIAAELEPERTADPGWDSIVARFPAIRLDRDAIARLATSRTMLERQLRDRRQALRGGDSAATPVIHADSIALDSVHRQVRRAFGDLTEAKLARAVWSERQLFEIMVDFWENHFSVFAGKGTLRLRLLEYDRDVIRPTALGHFRDLLRAVARSPVMLFYLDNWESAAEAERPTLAAFQARRRRPAPGPAAPRGPRRGLNENYARELLELHTVGVDGGYTQQDVINVARAFTGWSIDEPNRAATFHFRAALHDAGPKRIMGLELRAGRGIEDGEAVLDYLARQPATARFIATKLVRRFVSDSAPAALVARAADRFLRTNGDIREVLRTIVTSPEFFSRAAYQAKVKTPFELVASAFRAVGASTNPDGIRRGVAAIGNLGEPFFDHPAPDGYPDRADAWVNGGAIVARINFGLNLAKYPGVDWSGWMTAVGADRPTRSGKINAVIEAILGGDASDETRRVLCGSNSNGTDQSSGGSEPLGGVARMVGLALGSPEFQRR